MVRNYKKKRETEVNEDDVNNAILQVITGVMKLRQAADAYNIKPNTLHYRIKKYKEDVQLKSVEFTTKYSTSQVFNKHEERLLKEYIITRSKMHYGLTYKQTRQLAYEYATTLGKCPATWTEHREAGIDWLKGFMKRNRDLSLRKPENTSLSRSTSFNKHNVTEFYNNYEKVLRKYNFTPDRIFNLDETNIMTVVQAPNVIAQTGVKQVGQSVSAERGQLTTMCGIGNAIGNSLPPVFIFPRARFHDSMLNGGPPGSIGYANSPTSGWMTGSLFIKVLEHIKKLTRCSKEDPILVLMDNHESHCTLEAINYCRENGIVMVTFPPHCTHRMQPLDVAVNGPFKQKLSIAQNDWLVNHPGKTITIHDLTGIVTPAYNQSYTARNLLAGFSKPGIYPFNRNAFSDEDFDCAEVTNRPLPTTSDVHQPSTSDVPQPSTSDVPQPSTSDVPQLSISDVPQPSTSDVSQPSISDVPQPSTSDVPQPSVAVIPENSRSANLTTLEDEDMTDCEDEEQDQVKSCNIRNPEDSPALATAELLDMTAANSLEDSPSPLLLLREARGVITSYTSPTKQPACLIALEATAGPSTSTLPIVREDRRIHPALITSSLANSSFVSPEDVGPFPRAAPRKNTNKGRKKGKSRILTDTPEKDALEREVLEQEHKKLKKLADSAKRKLERENTKKKPVIKKKRKDYTYSSSEEEEFVIPPSPESDFCMSDLDKGDEESENENVDKETVYEGDWVVVNFVSNKQVSHRYVGQIINESLASYDVKFAKKVTDTKLKWPEKPDISIIGKDQVVKKIPPPMFKSSSKRVGAFQFVKSLRKFNINK